MKITFMGATQTVTGSKYLVDTGSKKILVDCGLFQGEKALRARNWQTLPVDPHKIDAVILTHAHIDHTGYVPLLVKSGFKNNIYCSEATHDLCSILLLDSAHIQEEEAKSHNLYHSSKHHPALPLYNTNDAKHSLNHFFPVDFENEFEIPKTAKFTLYPAGHILGASFVLLKSHGKSILFSGDIGRFNDAIMYPPTFIDSADFLVLESTYGDRLHSPSDPLEELGKIINNTVHRGGTIIIPSFAVGRAQLVLYMIYQLRKANRLPKVPIYLDSPMAINATEIFYKYAKLHRLGKKMAREICDTAKYVNDLQDSLSISASKEPKIIISASGMAEGGRVLHHLTQYAPHSKNTIVFIGYQVPGTRGDLITKGAKTVKIYGEEVPINAEIKFLNNMSAHADYEEILQWLRNFKKPPKKTFIIHGDPESNLSLKQKIEAQLKWKCVIPEYLQEIDLD